MATPKSSHVDRNFNYKPSSLRYRTIFGKEIAISLGWYSKNFDALFLRTAARYAHKNPTFFCNKIHGITRYQLVILLLLFPLLIGQSRFQGLNFKPNTARSPAPLRDLL
jgi:hypothetical protein